MGWERATIASAALVALALMVLAADMGGQEVLRAVGWQSADLTTEEGGYVSSFDAEAEGEGEGEGEGVEATTTEDTAGTDATPLQPQPASPKARARSDPGDDGVPPALLKDGSPPRSIVLIANGKVRNATCV
jgi:hypothetical protein